MPVPTTAQVVPGANVSIVLKADQRTGRQVQGTVKDLLTRGNHPRGIKVRLADGRIGRVQGLTAGGGGGGGGGGIMSGGGLANMASGGSASAPASQVTLNEEIQRKSAIQERIRGPDGGHHTGYRSERFVHKYSDVRFDEAAEQPPEQLDLFAYVKPGKQKKGKGRKNESTGEAKDDVNQGARKTGEESGVGMVSSAGEGQEASQSQQLPQLRSEMATCPVCGAFEGDEVAVAHHVEGHFR